MTTGTYNTTHEARAARPPRKFSDFAWTPANADEAKRIVALYPKGREASAIMPLLWLAQEQMASEVGSAWLPVPVIEYCRRADRHALYARLRGRDLLHDV